MYHIRVWLLQTCLGVYDAIQDGSNVFSTHYLKRLESMRYLCREKYRNWAIDVFRFHACRNTMPNSILSLTQEVFLGTYCISCENFLYLHDPIKNHPVFQSRNGLYSRSSKKRSEHQLLALLHYLGRNIMIAFTTREIFHMGYETHYLYVTRTANFICSLCNQAINWPGADEREEISARIKKNFDFSSCVRLVTVPCFNWSYSQYWTMIQITMVGSTNIASRFHQEWWS